MGSLTVKLTPEQSAFVKSEVAAGDYASVADVVDDALGLLRRERELAEEKTEILKREIEIGLADWRNGRLSDRSAMEILKEVLDEEEECGPG